MDADALNQLQRLVESQAALKEQVTGAITDSGAQSFAGTALGGAVTATVSGLGALRSIGIDVMAKRQYDNETLGDAVVEAVRAAEATARAALMERVLGTTVAQSLAGLVDPERLRRFMPGA